MNTPHRFRVAVPKPALSNESILESVLKSFSVEKSSSFWKELLEFIFPFMRISKYILIFREHGENIFLAHYAIYMPVQVFLSEVEEILVLGIR